MMRSTHKVIVGLGKTGYSCARYFHAREIPFEIVDRSEEPAYLDQIKAEMPEVKISTGEGWQLDSEAIDELVVSPGVPLVISEIVAARNAGVSVTGDVDIFSKQALAPIVAITGSNGKSTVTTMVGQMAERAGLKVGVGGNLGVPALDLLDEQSQLYVLELSSFQLETTRNLSASVATILNISADHMDRYDSENEYRKAKEKIFSGCAKAVLNRAEPETKYDFTAGVEVWSFGEDEPRTNLQTGLKLEDGVLQLMCGTEKLLPAAAMRTRGRHNTINALASIAIARAAGIPIGAIVETLKEFRGLALRCEWVANLHEVDVFNDSKATNVGATNAAVCGLGEDAQGRIILIAGGEGKGADFRKLRESVGKYVATTILFGKDASLIDAAISDIVEVVSCKDLFSAFEQAMEKATVGDVVLFSPACASFDMFDDYIQRGDVFNSIVNDYVAGSLERRL